MWYATGSRHWGSRAKCNGMVLGRAAPPRRPSCLEPGHTDCQKTDCQSLEGWASDVSIPKSTPDEPQVLFFLKASGLHGASASFKLYHFKLYRTGITPGPGFCRCKRTRPGTMKRVTSTLAHREHCFLWQPGRVICGIFPA